MFILDSHVTHTKNLAATDMAREAGVVMVSLPPHTTHRFQPLGGAFFGPFGKYYNDALMMWMKEHVGRPVTTWQVDEILNVAYRKVSSDFVIFINTKLRPNVFRTMSFSAYLISLVSRDFTFSRACVHRERHIRFATRKTTR